MEQFIVGCKTSLVSDSSTRIQSLQLHRCLSLGNPLFCHIFYLHFQTRPTFNTEKKPFLLHIWIKLFVQLQMLSYFPPHLEGFYICSVEYTITFFLGFLIISHVFSTFLFIDI